MKKISLGHSVDYNAFSGMLNPTQSINQSVDFLHSGTDYIENSRVLKNSITISITKMGIAEPVTLKQPCLFHADSITISIMTFCTVEHPLYNQVLVWQL